MNAPSKKLKMSSHLLSRSSRQHCGHLCAGKAASDWLTMGTKGWRAANTQVFEEGVSWAETSTRFYKRAHYRFFLLIRVSVVAELPEASKYAVTHLILQFCWWELSGCQPWSWELSMWFLQVWEGFSSWASPRRWHRSTRMVVFFPLGSMGVLKIIVLWSDFL